jgi:hypothetical protein
MFGLFKGMGQAIGLGLGEKPRRQGEPPAFGAGAPQMPQPPPQAQANGLDKFGSAVGGSMGVGYGHGPKPPAQDKGMWQDRSISGPFMDPNRVWRGPITAPPISGDDPGYRVQPYTPKIDDARAGLFAEMMKRMMSRPRREIHTQF